MNEAMHAKNSARSGMSLLELMVGCAVVSTVMAVGMPKLTRKIVTSVYGEEFVQEVVEGKQVEKPAIRYESYQAKQLAVSAVRKIQYSRHDAEYAKMDKNNDLVITEDEVISYVRSR